MRWGRKKQCSSPSLSGHSLISNVLPSSWISKFKRVNTSSEAKIRNGNEKWKQNLMSASLQKDFNCKDGRFYVRDNDEAFWSLSFRKESNYGKKSRDFVESIWYDSDDELDFPSKTGEREELRKIRELTKDVDFLSEMCKCEREKQKSENANGWKSRKGNQRFVEERMERVRRTMRDSRKHRHVSSLNWRNSDLSTIKEDGNDGFSVEFRSKGTEELKSKSEKQRKSLYISRGLQRKRRKPKSKFRVRSPKMASENMNRKLKMKAGEMDRGLGVQTGLESFAVVKSSFDPQQDFRDSMVSMIVQKRISRPEELEELLACYLTLNSDEYHDLIIKIFRQVWFDLIHTCFDTELQNE